MAKKEKSGMNEITIHQNLYRNVLFIMAGTDKGKLGAFFPYYHNLESDRPQLSGGVFFYHIDSQDYPIKNWTQMSDGGRSDAVIKYLSSQDCRQRGAQQLGFMGIFEGMNYQCNVGILWFIVRDTVKHLSHLGGQILPRLLAPVQQAPVQEKAQAVNDLLNRLAKVENFDFGEIEKKSNEVAKGIADLQKMQNALEQVEGRLSEIRQSFQQRHEQISL